MINIVVGNLKQNKQCLLGIPTKSGGGIIALVRKNRIFIIRNIIFKQNNKIFVFFFQVRRKLFRRDESFANRCKKNFTQFLVPGCVLYMSLQAANQARRIMHNPKVCNFKGLQLKKPDKQHCCVGNLRQQKYLLTLEGRKVNLFLSDILNDGSLFCRE